MPSFQAHLMNLIFRSMPGDDGESPHDYAAERARNDRQPPKTPKGVTVEQVTLSGIHAEWLHKEGNDKGLVYYIHGGGFCTGSARERRQITQEIVSRHGYQCIACDYRLAPENKWPAQLEDCLLFYRALLEQGAKPERIVLMGESAGGTLVLSLALRLKELGLPQPGAVVSFSPCVNQAEHYPSHFENIGTDYMLRDAVAKGMGEPVFGPDVTQEYLRSACVSPVYGDYAGLPPMFLSASDTEALYDDSRALYEQLQKQNHPAQLDVQHGVCHAFQVFVTMPEAKKAMKKVMAFLETCRK